MKNQAGNPLERKTYRAPKLVVYGDIRTVTQTTTNTKSNDGQNNKS
jgi:hypothetical protein